MIIPGYEIVKKEAANLSGKTNYFFFMTKDDQIPLSKFQF
jgi:hypothetical protein